VLPAAGAELHLAADATLDVVNNQLVLDFDASSNETARWQAVMPQAYAAGGVDVILHISMATATSGDVDWDVEFEDQAGQVISSDSFASAQSTDNTTVPGVANTEFTVTVSFTDGSQMDSVGAGDMFRMRVTRDAASDTAAGDAQLHIVEIREA